MASKGVNKVILVGNVGNIESRATADGRAITNVSLATSESWKDKSGMTQDKTEWHRVVIFGKTAEIASQYLQKGAQVYFEGKLATRKWEDKTGATRYTTEVVVDGFNGMMQMLDRKGSTEGQSYNSHQNDHNDKENTVTQENSIPVKKIEPMDDFGIASSTISFEGDKLPF